MPVALVERALVGSIIDSFYAVYNYFGFGLAEVVYAGALELELLDRGHAVARELAVAVAYKGRHVAWQRLDMVVDDKVIVELKATDKLSHHLGH
jgi:GxxExxY protein